MRINLLYVRYPESKFMFKTVNWDRRMEDVWILYRSNIKTCIYIFCIYFVFIWGHWQPFPGIAWQLTSAVANYYLMFMRLKVKIRVFAMFWIKKEDVLWCWGSEQPIFFLNTTCKCCCFLNRVPIVSNTVAHMHLLFKQMAARALLNKNFSLRALAV
jgi:hypothetical protein